MMPLPTEEDLEAIKRYVIIPMVLTVLQRDKKVIEDSALKTKQPYLSLMDAAMKKAHGEIYDTRVSLRSSRIKIYDEKRTENTIEIKYTFRGYQHTASLLWHIIKNDVESMIQHYLGAT
jgi:hypothetical protein